MTAKDMSYYIGRQPAAMREALPRRAETCRAFCELWARVRPDRVYLVGSGTSCSAIHAAAPFMEETLQTEVTAVSPTSLPRVFSQRPLLVYVSQGGASTNLLRAIQATRQYAGIVLTGEERCPATEACGCFVTLACEREEAGPKTMGYALTVLTLYEMALEAAREARLISPAAYAARVSALESAANGMAENIAAVERWYQAVEERLARQTLYLFAGIGVGSAVAREAALKVQETTLHAAIGFEYEEFLHGPIAMLHRAPAGLYLLPAAATENSARMEKLAQIHGQFSPDVWMVRRGERRAVDAHSITLQASEEDWLAPFWQILPAQIVSARLPARIGTEGGLHRLFSRIDEAVGIKAAR